MRTSWETSLRQISKEQKPGPLQLGPSSAEATGGLFLFDYHHLRVPGETQAIKASGRKTGLDNKWPPAKTDIKLKRLETVFCSDQCVC